MKFKLILFLLIVCNSIGYTFINQDSTNFRDVDVYSRYILKNISIQTMLTDLGSVNKYNLTFKPNTYIINTTTNFTNNFNLTFQYGADVSNNSNIIFNNNYIVAPSNQTIFRNGNYAGKINNAFIYKIWFSPQANAVSVASLNAMIISEIGVISTINVTSIVTSTNLGSTTANVVTSSMYDNETITFYGDSITDTPYGETWQPYVTQYFKMTGINKGVSGMRISGTTNAAACHPDKIATIPVTTDVLIVMLGVNDWNGRVAFGSMGTTNTLTMYGSVTTMAIQLAQRLPSASIYFCSPPQGKMGYSAAYGIRNTDGYLISAFGNICKEVANIYGFGWIDVYGESGINEHNIDKYMKWESGNYYLHPLATGGERIARCIVRGMERFEPLIHSTVTNTVPTTDPVVPTPSDVTSSCWEPVCSINILYAGWDVSKDAKADGVTVTALSDWSNYNAILSANATTAPKAYTNGINGESYVRMQGGTTDNWMATTTVNSHFNLLGYGPYTVVWVYTPRASTVLHGVWGNFEVNGANSTGVWWNDNNGSDAKDGFAIRQFVTSNLIISMTDYNISTANNTYMRVITYTGGVCNLYTVSSNYGAYALTRSDTAVQGGDARYPFTINGAANQHTTYNSDFDFYCQYIFTEVSTELLARISTWGRQRFGSALIW